MAQFKNHLTYANVVATLALIVAVAGGSTAIAVSSKVKKNSVGTKQLKKGSVTLAKLADGAVTSAKIADGNVTASKLASIRVDVDSRTPASVGLATCHAPERLLGGGATETGGTLAVSAPDTSGTNPSQWDGGGTSGTSAAAYALCLKDTPGP